MNRSLEKSPRGPLSWWQRRGRAFTGSIAALTIVGSPISLNEIQSHVVHRASAGIVHSTTEIGPSRRPHATPLVQPLYPVGVADTSEPSSVAPPSPLALPGYRQTYVSDFGGSALPAGWSAYEGTPSSDPGGYWSVSHTVVAGGLLQENAFRDPIFQNNWVTGGVCQCGSPRTYGAYFVRSRMTGPGPTQVELLWPTSGWPPEIDFNETYGAATSSMATVHFNPTNSQIHRTVHIDMTQWHTWGLVWSPKSLVYIVDGRVWGSVSDPAVIPNQLMTLDIQQQTFCASGWACPTSPQSLQVDWVAEYSPSVAQSIAIGPFAPRSTTLSATGRSLVAHLAMIVQDQGGKTVNLVGYGDSRVSGSNGVRQGRVRAMAVASYLKRELALLHAGGVSISTIGATISSSSTTSSTPPDPLRASRVYVTIGG
jgi:Glycosyl hydrolases family 16